MKAVDNYIRVGTEYFKEIQQPLISGDTIKVYQKWNKATITDDFGRDALKDIKKYEGFCTIPSHTIFKSEINGFLNRYEELSYDFSRENKFDNIEFFMKHIFKEHYDLAMDYLTILWQHPTQILPILCLVSTERNTGKSTFLKLLKTLFEGNMTINKNEDFRSRFNSDWASKLIIAVDEVLLDKREDSERIKNLSTSGHFKSESKGIDKSEIEFFGKFILCSNNEDNFIKTDKDEIRYWVIKVERFQTENPQLLDIMHKEIPFFANHLTHRNIVTKKTTRMWFTKEQIKTDALLKLIGGNRSSTEREIEDFLIDQFQTLEVETLYYSATDLMEELNKLNNKVQKSYVAKVLKDHFKLESTNSSYTLYKLDLFSGIGGKWKVYQEPRKGRFFTFKKEDFIKNG